MERTEMDALQMLQGTWRQIGFEENGVLEPKDDHSAPSALTTIIGHTFHVGIPDGETLLEGVFVLAGPCQIDWIDSMGDDAGRALKAHYRLGSDTFAFAAADFGQERPHNLSGGAGITVRRFTRVS